MNTYLRVFIYLLKRVRIYMLPWQACLCVGLVWVLCCTDVSLIGDGKTAEVDEDDGFVVSYLHVSVHWQHAPAESAIWRVLLYLFASELFLHGWLFHPYAGFFLSVHGGPTAPAASKSAAGASAAAGALPAGAVPEEEEEEEEEERSLPVLPEEHGELAECQPTHSVYSVCATLSTGCLNHHVEHHDFPQVTEPTAYLRYVPDSAAQT